MSKHNIGCMGITYNEGLIVLQSVVDRGSLADYLDEYSDDITTVSPVRGWGPYTHILSLSAIPYDERAPYQHYLLNAVWSFLQMQMDKREG